MSDQSSVKPRCTWIEIRGASGADPGEIALVYYVVHGEVVLLTDAQGQRRKDEDGNPLSARTGPGEDCAMVARRLARRPGQGILKSRERRLLYEMAYIV